MATKAKPRARKASARPESRELDRLLGDAREAFRALTERGRDTTCEWTYDVKRSEWSARIRKGERTLFYVRPAEGCCNVAVLLGERAVAAALSGRVSKRLHEAIRSATRYPEGRAVRMVVKSESGARGVEELVAVKLDPEGRAG